MKTLLILLVTTFGNIAIEVDADKAPKSAENFVQYVKDGHYNGTQFHRVIPGFMVQGGGFDEGMTQKPTREPIMNEGGNGLRNVRGSVAMARTSSPNSATSQFFINTVDNRFLDRDASQDGVGYAVFGKVVQGMDVVDRIEKTATGTRFTPMGPMSDVPKTPVMIIEAKVIDRLPDTAAAPEKQPRKIPADASPRAASGRY